MKSVQQFFRAHKLVLVVAIGLVLAYLMYPHPRSASRKAGVTEIVFWAPAGGNDQMAVAIEEFERRNPQYRVLMGSAAVRDNTGDPTRFLLGVAGDVPPDLIYFDRFAVVEWASRGAFEDLTPYLEEDKVRADGIHQENFLAPAWEEAVYKGKVYAVPNSVDTRAMYFHHGALIRAGFVHRPGDPKVVAGEVEVGDVRAPETWEELCLKKAHLSGSVSADGFVEVHDFVRRPAVNDSVPSDAVVDLGELGVRANDVIAVVGGGEVFRGRIAEVMDGTRLRIDMSFEQLPSLKRLPGTVTGGSCEVKVFDQESYVPRLTRYDTATGQLSTLGFAPLFGNSFLCMFAWLNGAEFMNEDGTEVLLDSEPIVEALQFISDIYDAQGGIQNVNAFQTTVASGALDPWISGAIAMRFDLGGLIDAVSIFKPDLAFGAAGAPIPRERLEAGHTSVGWMGGWAYAIPSTAKYKEAAWDLMRWFCSVEANQLMYRFQASQAKARGWGFFPPHHPDYRVMEWLEQEFIAGNPAITDYMRDAFHVFVDLLPTSRYRPVTPVGQRLWSEHIRATDAAISHTKNPYDALNYGKRRVQVDLDRIQTPPSGPLVPWKKIIVIYSIAIVAVFVGLVLYQERKRIKAGGVYREWIPGYVCASPWIVGFVTLGCGPIIFSMIISFSHYDVLNPARFIGFTNYVNLMGFHGDPVVNESVPNDPLFWRSLANTAFMIIGVPLGIVAGLALAMLLNAKVKGLQIFRTIYYLPAIVPAVASFVLWIWIFDPVRGFLNQILRILGVSDPPHWLQDPVWAKPALIIMGLWGVGAGMIIWLAGLKEIPESLYEAARIDGASRVQQFRHVTLPLLTPYIFFNFIMGMIGVFQVFEAAYIMTSGGPADATLFYAYKLFNEAFRYLNMGTASAMAWIMFVVILAITLFQLWFSKKWVHYER